MYYFPNFLYGNPYFMMSTMHPLFYQQSHPSFEIAREIEEQRPAKLQSELNLQVDQEICQKPNEEERERNQDEGISEQIQNRPKKGFDQFRKFSIAKNLIGKNTRSNLLRYFLMYLEDCIEATGKIDRIIEVHKLQISKEEFKEMSKTYVKHTRYYFKPKLFSNLCRQVDCHKQFSLVFRILLRMFLKMDLGIFIRKSPRLRRKTKLSYLYIAKKLQSDILKTQRKSRRKKR